MIPKPILTCLFGAALGVIPPAHAQLAITNGDFETGGGANIQDVTDWFDNNTGGFWEGTWQSNAQTPNGTNVTVFSSFEADDFGAPTPDANDGGYLYQAIGTANGETSVTISFDWGAPTDDNTSRDLGVTVGIYAYDGVGAFTPADGTDVRGAAGVTLLDSASYTSLAGTRSAGGTIFTGNQVTLDLTGAGAQQLFLRFNNYLPTTTECWPVVDNVLIAPDSPVFTVQPVPYYGFVGDAVTLTASASSSPSPTYQWQFSETGADPWSDLAGEESASLVLDPAAFTDNGYYRVVADNGTSATSDEVLVDLIYPDPVIVQEPRSGAVQVGNDAFFTVEATGQGTLTYQWSSVYQGVLADGAKFSGVTGPTLTVSNAQLADDGDLFYCTITDNAATEQASGEADTFIDTADAELLVFEAPTTTLLSFEPFSAYPTGVILTDEDPAIAGYVDPWLDEAFGDVPPTTSAGSLAYGGAGYVAGIGGKVGSVVDTANLGAGNSGRAARMLDVELKAYPVSSQVRYLSWLFKTGNEGTAPDFTNNYQILGLWNGNSGDDALRVFEAGIALGDFGTANYGFRVNNTTAVDLAVAPDSGVHLFVAKFELNPADNSDTVTVWIDPALGAGEPAGGVSVSGVDLSWDRLTVSDYAGDSSEWDEIRWGTTFDSVTVEAPAMPLIPEFTLEPADKDGFVGGSVTLDASADGDPTPTYEWQYSETGLDPWTPVAGGTSSTLVIDPAAYSDNGYYRVVASNINGSATSLDALVTISYPEPVITQQPVATAVVAGSNAQFTVVATGLGTLGYQWYKVDGGGDIELTGETSDTLDLAGVSTADAGEYYVIVSDDAGVADEGVPAESISAAATLTVVNVLVSESDVAPATDSDDQFWLPGNVDDVDNIDGTGVLPWENDGSTYVAADKTSQGMTFTTGSDPLGYTIQSITVRNVRVDNYLDNGSWYDIQDLDTFEFQFGTVTGGVKSMVFDTDTAQYSGAALVNVAPPNNFGSGKYLTFDLSAAGIGTLLPNTTYYFEIASETGDAFFELSGTKADGYPGGTAFRGDTIAAIDATYVELAGDRAFHVDLTGLSAPADDFASWIGGYPGVGGATGFKQDSDNDLLPNGVENYLGTDPSVWNKGLVEVSRSGSTVTFQHPNPNPSSDVTGEYVWTTDLGGYHGDGETVGATTVTFSATADSPVAGTTTVTATVTGTMPAELFVAIQATLATP